MKTPLTIGVDFGTTNTVVALGDGAHASLVAFATPAEPRRDFRSTLSFNADPVEATGRAVNAGPWAI